MASGNNTASFVGTWEVEKCTVDGTSGIKSGLEGTRFVLDECGDVTWNTTNEDITNIPLFSCENYEVSDDCPNKGIVIKFGTFDGELIEFIAEPADPINRVTLRCEKWCILHCVKVATDEPDINPNDIYTLLPAVEEGFFSDMVVEAQDHKQFHVHSSILGLLGTDMCWMTDPAPFTGLPEPVVGSVLHWLYAECLPPDMTEELAQQVVQEVRQYPCLGKLTEDCHVYLKNMALKQKIIDIVCDMHTCINHIVEYFTPEESLGAHPTKLCLVVKQSFRETAVVLVKLLVLCEVFTKEKCELSKEEKQEIVKYVRSRVPVFMGQVRRLLEALNGTLSSMTHTQRHELATYIVPEIEAILTTVSSLIFEVKVALEQIMQALSPHSSETNVNPETASEPPHPQGVPPNMSPNPIGTPDDALAESLRNVFRLRELAKLKNFHKKVSFTFMHLLYKKESFAAMSDSNKMRSVMRNLELLVEELPVFLVRLDEVATAMDERLQWREFKFCFKVASSKISGVLNKLLLHRDTLHEVVMRLCNLVERDAFTHGMVSLGMLQGSSQGAQSKPAASSSSFCNGNKQHGYKLSLVQTLMKSPHACNSALSKAAGRLLKSERFADMIFEIPVNTPAQTPVTPVPKTAMKKTSHLMSPTEQQRNGLSTQISNATTGSSESGAEDSDASTGGGSGGNNNNANSVIIKAHRVIVAARCDWFRRALQSGMKEAIHRKIVIHDTTPTHFRKLLSYLYTGKLDTRVCTPEQLTELILLGDRYELDAMKLACERALASKHLDKETVFYYLSLADQYNAGHLKEACIKFTLYENGVLESAEFNELPASLQNAVYSVVDSCGTPPQCLWPPNSHYSPGKPGGNIIRRHSPDEASNSDGSSVAEISVDRIRLNDCLARLRDVLGPDVPLEDLNRVALAADCDANRAVNFYYSQATSSSSRSDPES